VLIGQMAGGVFVAIASFVVTERFMKTSERNQIPNLREPAFRTHQRALSITHRQR